MKNKKERNIQSNKVVLFPGAIDRLITRAHECVEKGKFDEANGYFAEALKFYEGDELTLSVYSYSLYETRQYEKAKEVCEKLLNLGPSMYLEVAELYITICMQLKQFQQVEKMIRVLLKEKKIPEDQIQNFERLLELNANIAQSKETEEKPNEVIPPETFEADYFLSLDLSDQMKEIHMLHTTNIRPILPQLQGIVEHQKSHPIIKSLILILFVEQQVSMDLKIVKFGEEMVINPIQLNLPTKMPQYLEVSKIINNELDDNPTFLEMVNSIVAKHTIITYPFEWFDFDSQVVAKSYIAYVEGLFGNEQSLDFEFSYLLHALEEISQLL